MSGSIPSFSQQEVSSWKALAEDPVSLRASKKSVALVPCGHSMNLLTALQHFGGSNPLFDADRNLQLKSQGECPTCRSHIFTYIHNHGLRLVEQILSQLQPIGEQVSEESRLEFPFPGQRARFVCSIRWGLYFYRAELPHLDQDEPIPKRTMVFNSITPGSLFTRVIVSGDSHQDKEALRPRHDITIKVECEPSQQEVFKLYLLRLELTSHLNNFVATQASQLDLTLYFLAANNAFPGAEYKLLRSLVETKDWLDVEETIEAKKLAALRKLRKMKDEMKDEMKMENPQSSSETVNNEVLLVPCGHSLSSSIAEQSFHKAPKNMHRVIGKCQTCKSNVLTYLPNYGLRDASGILDQIQARVVSALSAVDAPQQVPDRPSIEAIVRKDPWHICRMMTFQSTTPDSFLT